MLERVEHGALDPRASLDLLWALRGLDRPGTVREQAS